MNDKNGKEFIHDFSNTPSIFTIQLFIILSVFALLGIGTGYLLARKNAANTTSVHGSSTSEIAVGTIYGSDDMKTFKDATQGHLEQGGIGDEGQYHITRPGGESQNVYLTSSLIDLSKFVGHDVKVFGQTQKGKKAGWLMDVGRLEVIK